MSVGGICKCKSVNSINRRCRGLSEQVRVARPPYHAPVAKEDAYGTDDSEDVEDFVVAEEGWRWVGPLECEDCSTNRLHITHTYIQTNKLKQKSATQKA